MAELELNTAPIEKIDDGVVLSLNGPIDAATALPFQGALEDLTTKGVKHVIIDMDGVKFVNSTGLGCLVRTADAATSGGGTFNIARVHPKVKIVFSTLGLDTFFTISRSLDDAKDRVYEALGMIEGADNGDAVAAVPKPAPAAPKTSITERKTVVAYVTVPHSVPDAAEIYARVAAACKPANVVIKHPDPAGPDDAWRKDPTDVKSANFIIADFSGDPDTGQVAKAILDLAHIAKNKVKPPKPVLCLVQHSSDHVPPPWNARPFITYAPGPEGLVQLQAKVEAAVRRALPRLR